MLAIFDSLGFILFTQGAVMPSSYVVGDHFESFIKKQIKQGRYASASEVIRDGLRALEDREHLRVAKLELLRQELQLGADSGAGIASKTVFAAVRKRIRQTAAKSGPR
jgi:antitoxin ParD1/3/4